VQDGTVQTFSSFISCYNWIFAIIPIWMCFYCEMMGNASIMLAATCVVNDFALKDVILHLSVAYQSLISNFLVKWFWNLGKHILFSSNKYAVCNICYKGIYCFCIYEFYFMAWDVEHFQLGTILIDHCATIGARSLL